MAKPELPPGQLRKRDKVVARNDLRDIPEGTPGKVILVNGFAWVRYWVKFDNGVYLGSIDRSELATADEWQRHLAGEDVFSAGAGVGAGSSDGASDDGGGDSGSAGGKTTPSGTLVPQKLLDRSSAARIRLAA
ncbi:MAG: hypothetical protein IPG97_02540 [Microthrixaceae bacterium]|nr:hypothetical protein [Microthrixaceae bacterium]